LISLSNLVGLVSSMNSNRALISIPPCKNSARVPPATRFACLWSQGRPSCSHSREVRSSLVCIVCLLWCVSILLPSCPRAPGAGAIAKGSFVRIKASVTEPRCVILTLRGGSHVLWFTSVCPWAEYDNRSGWGGLSHGSIGVVKEVANDGFIVAFPEMDTWKGHAHELEALPTHPKVPLPAVSCDGVLSCVITCGF
jgi:hypothetical protein